MTTTRHKIAATRSGYAPVYYINRAPIALNGCCCEIANEIGTGERPRAWKIVGAFVLAAALAVVAIGIARAAERNAAWDVFAFRDGRLLQADAPNIVPVQSSGPFPSKELCVDVGIQTAKIRDSGWRLSCRRVK